MLYKDVIKALCFGIQVSLSGLIHHHFAKVNLDIPHYLRTRRKFSSLYASSHVTFHLCIPPRMELVRLARPTEPAATQANEVDSATYEGGAYQDQVY